MKRNMLNEVHQTQLEDMVKKDDKQPIEIIKFFKDSYDINILPSKISLLRKKFGLKKKGSNRGPYKSKKIPVALPISEGMEEMGAEMAGIIIETRKTTKDVFSMLRLELLKSHNEVFLMKKGLGRI